MRKLSKDSQLLLGCLVFCLSFILGSYGVWQILKLNEFKDNYIVESQEPISLNNVKIYSYEVDNYVP